MSDAAQTPPHTPQGKKDNLTKGLLIALGVIFVLAGVGYYAAKSGMSKAEAQAQLASFNEALAHYGASHGYEVKFSYQDLEIHGGIFSKKAELKNAELTVKPVKEEAFYQPMNITSPRVEIAAKDSAFSAFSVSFPEPLTIASPEGSTQAAFSKPLEITVEREPGETGTAANYSAELPPSLTVTRPDATVAEISFGEGSIMSGMVNLSASNYSHETQINKLKIAESDETLNAASITATVESGVQDKTFMKHQSFDVKELAFDGQRAALGKLNLAVDIESDMPQPSENADAAPATKDTAINALKLEAADQAFAVNTKGSLAAPADELLPQGQLEVTISKPDALIDRLNQAGLLNPMMEKIAYSILPKIDNAWKAGGETVQFTLKRHAGEPLYVGNLTFEELTAQIFSGLLQQSTPSAGESEPAPAETPAAEDAAPDASQSPPADPINLGIDMEEFERMRKEKMKVLQRRLEENDRKLEQSSQNPALKAQ